MRFEFYKLGRSHFFYFTIFFSVILLIGYAFYYYQKKTDDEGILFSSIEPYQSIQEINNHLEEVKNEFISLDPFDSDYQWHLERLTKKRNIYEYLSRNYIPYNEIIEFDDLYHLPFRNHFVAYQVNQFNLISWIIILSSLLLSLHLISLDFLYGTQKVVYTVGESRLRIVLKKYAVVVIFAIILYLSLSLIGLVFGIDYIRSKSYILFTNNRVRAIPIKTFLVLYLFSNFFNTWILITTFYFICVLFRSVFPALLATIIFIAVTFFLIPTLLPTWKYLFYAVPPLDWLEMNGGIGETIIFIIIKLLILSLIVVSSLYRFKKSDMV